VTPWPLLHWLAIHTGTLNEPGPYYGFWSGFGSILERLVELTVIGGILLRHKNCHHHGCPRIGRHVVDGTPWCDKHHQQARTDLAARTP
jgi:hypothetical protein